MTTISIPEPIGYFACDPDTLEPVWDEGCVCQDNIYNQDDMDTVGRAIIFKDQAEAYAATKVRESQQWQPIETAPKDGTQILLWGPCCDIVTCFWAAYDSPPYWCIGSIEVDGDGFAALRGEPTHWMPLPAPPLPGPVEP